MVSLLTVAHRGPSVFDHARMWTGRKGNSISAMRSGSEWPLADLKKSRSSG
jgi:hypothetical protein